MILVASPGVSPLAWKPFKIHCEDYDNRVVSCEDDTYGDDKIEDAGDGIEDDGT